MTSKFLIVTIIVMAIVIINGCINEEFKHAKMDEILNIGKGIQEGWNYTIITKNIEDIEMPHGIWKPVAIVDIVSKDEKGNNSSLRLYFYNITEKQEIVKIIDQEKIYSWCIPIYFDETNRYIIITSPCYINIGITDNDKNNYSILEKSLKEFFKS